MIRFNSNFKNLIDSDVVKPDIVSWSLEEGSLMSTKSNEEEDDSSDNISNFRDHHNRHLFPSFQPNNFTVMIGRCKEARSNIGNRRLRVLASTYLSRYAKADSKRVKSNIVREIRDAILEAEGQFIQRDEDNHWYIVNDAVAREKIGYVLRDLLADQYKSSSKQKSAVAKERRHREQLRKDSCNAAQVPCTLKKNSNHSFHTVAETTTGGDEMEELLDIWSPTSRTELRQGQGRVLHSSPLGRSVPSLRQDHFPW